MARRPLPKKTAPLTARSAADGLKMRPPLPFGPVGHRARPSERHCAWAPPPAGRAITFGLPVAVPWPVLDARADKTPELFSPRTGGLRPSTSLKWRCPGAPS